MCNSFWNVRHVKCIEIKCFLVQNGRENVEHNDKKLKSATKSHKNIERVGKRCF